MAKRFIVACGGTGGHTFPGLAVARELVNRGHEVAVWTAGRAIENSVMKGWDGAVFSTRARPLALRHAPGILYSIMRCRREMRRFKPDALLAMGSYASLPPVLAARAKGVRTILHEANTIPGRAVEFLSRYANAVAISFADTERFFPEGKTRLTGLPIRENIGEDPRFNDVPREAFVVFITGGSQGAHRVNELCMQALPIVKRELERMGKGDDLYVIHQTGAADEEAVRAVYASHRIASRVNAFEHEMARAFATADFTICRAGASTCFELAQSAAPALFIPLPSAMRNHQHFNAEAFVKAGAAMEAIQETVTPRSLANHILFQYSHPDHLEAMREKMKSLAIPDAASRVADLVEGNC
ncbi:MAG: UDP-N-acetylglucosamine--N-acetylmuramyl-(pentapeptide) pyrophosphoryl-undecaprenol N-acetylglucosamine transferase [Kiritimatiellae bacterium]|nr:UDP-N-acetylglucosamine--N-acetylmuramyl-(pentapeptide) pyrophosphoryl-undecaprenol N-acetylglucosamine transferase [Kiritimatiellia bacterium]